MANTHTNHHRTRPVLPPENETEAERDARYAREWDELMAEERRDREEAEPPLPPPPPQPPPRVFPGPSTASQTGKKNTKASIKIAALNIKGNGNASLYSDNKWWHIWQILRDQNLGMLKLRIEISPGPDNPTGARGVAFVIHRDKIQMDGISTTEVVPGRAMILNVKQKDGSPLSILGVYAPNAPAENAAFWKKIWEWYEERRGMRGPDLMGGDTNIVESPLDRLPARADPSAPVDALDELKIRFNLIDGYRETNPTTRAYTYLQKHTGSQSRIDRFYIRRDLFDNSFEWGIRTTGIETDHRMISLRLTCRNATEMGRGRWTWPKHLNEDPILTRYIDEKGKIYEENLEKAKVWEARAPDFNPQNLWANFKSDIVKKARERAKIVVRKLSAAVITEKIIDLEKKRHRASRLTAQVRNRIEGEVIGRYWSKINKPTKPKEVIQRLRKEQPNPEDEPTYETDSKKMATMARNYHNKIQYDRTETPQEVRTVTTEKVLSRVNRKTTE
ncbi:DNase I-like protein [Favolaschia claudopus]|uniref:DNase I-like protein n=1 Tax=Favolaschia claudopus TaxID=2862362 RepID=A0AAW0ATP7_9AGAR